MEVWSSSFELVGSHGMDVRGGGSEQKLCLQLRPVMVASLDVTPLVGHRRTRNLPFPWILSVALLSPGENQ